MQYLVSGNVLHDGKLYREGDTLEVTAEQAAPLIEIGVLASADGAEPEKPEEARAPRKRKSKEEGPEVGGDKPESGEPSVDGPSDAPKAEAKDVTPASGLIGRFFGTGQQPLSGAEESGSNQVRPEESEAGDPSKDL